MNARLPAVATPEEKAEARRLYDLGLSTIEVARASGRSPSWAYVAVKASGGSFRSPHQNAFWAKVRKRLARDGFAPWTWPQAREAACLSAEGAGHKDIAERLGVPAEAVRAALSPKKAGRRPEALTPREIGEIKRLYLDEGLSTHAIPPLVGRGGRVVVRALYEGGQSTRQVGEWFGCSASSVARHLRANGVEIRPRPDNFRKGRKEKSAAA